MECNDRVINVFASLVDACGFEMGRLVSEIWKDYLHFPKPKVAEELRPELSRPFVPQMNPVIPCFRLFPPRCSVYNAPLA
ncbi:hypothetical protein LXL04_037846 [Taraxacum kok-saghyz]